MTILTSGEADPLIRAAMLAGEVISDDVAHTIAWWHSAFLSAPGALLMLVNGKDVDPDVLREHVTELAKAATPGTVEELYALERWAISRCARIEVTTYRLTGDEWEGWENTRGTTDAERPDGVTGSTEVVYVADYRDDRGGWVHPEDPRLPEDTSGFEVGDDGELWLPGSVEVAAHALLTGAGPDFYAQSYGGDPWDGGPLSSWWYTDPVEDQEPGKAYASWATDYRTGEVEIKIARLLGFSAVDERAVFAVWKNPD
jgi:hypothetical protein